MLPCCAKGLLGCFRLISMDRSYVALIACTLCGALGGYLLGMHSRAGGGGPATRAEPAPKVEEEEEEEEQQQQEQQQSSCGGAMDAFSSSVPRAPTLQELQAAIQEEFEEEEEDSALVPEDQFLKMVCLVRKDLSMSKGKIAAQTGHAFVGTYRIAMRLPLCREWVKAWSARGCKKITLHIGSEAELLACHAAALEAGLPSTVIEDAGRTEVEPGTKTVCAIGPAPDHLIDELTGKKGRFACRLLE